MKVKTIVSLVVILVILGIGFFGYVLYLDGQARLGQVIQPQPDQTASWNALKNDELRFSLKYPSGFFDVGHEPQITGNSGPCTVDPSINYPDPVTVNGVLYHHVEIVEGAAGHRYYTDYYVSENNNECLTIKLDTFESVCENYLPLEQGNTEQATNYNACMVHRENRPKVLQQIINTFKFN